MRRILVPLDGSDLAMHALPYVEELATCLKAEVFFIRVVDMLESHPFSGMSSVDLLNPEVMAEGSGRETATAQSDLSTLAREWQSKGIDAKWEVVDETIIGVPAPAILEFASAHNIELIAMTTHGRSGISRLVFGSVAEQVVRGSSIPVLVVKPVENKA